MPVLVLPDDMVIESIKFRSKEPHCCSDATDDLYPTLRVDFFDGGGGYYYELRGSEGFAFDPRDAVNRVAGFLTVCEHNDAVQAAWDEEERKRSERVASSTPPLSASPTTSCTEPR